MIPEIGLLIGGYIWVRLLSFCTRKDARAEHVAVKVFAILGMIAVPLIVIDMMLSGRGIIPPVR